jgi:hypothetical protein
MLGRALPSLAAAVRRFASDQHAVSEVVGYLLTFAIAVVLLVAALQTFSVVQDYSQDLAAGTIAEDIANRIVFAVLQATDVAQRLPGVQYDFIVGLPTEIRGRPYRIEMTNSTVYVNESGGMSASAPLLNAPASLLLCQGPNTLLADGTCYVPGHTPEVTIAYARTKDALGVTVTGVFFRKTG